MRKRPHLTHKKFWGQSRMALYVAHNIKRHSGLSPKYESSRFAKAVFSGLNLVQKVRLMLIEYDSLRSHRDTH